LSRGRVARDHMVGKPETHRIQASEEDNHATALNVSRRADLANWD
jgi:hypothetical protein